jgi:hypothetical protein
MIPISYETPSAQKVSSFPPTSVISRLKSGHGFGNSALYSEEESKLLAEDIAGIVSAFAARQWKESLVAILSIGEPFPERSALMQILAQHLCFAYISPEELLPQFLKTYGRDLKTMQVAEARKKWRPAAHAAAYQLLQQLLKKRLGFVWVSSTTALLGEHLSQQGYEVILKHFINSKTQSVDPSLERVSCMRALRINRIDFFWIKPGSDVSFQCTASLSIVKASQKFEIRVYNQAAYLGLKTLYNILASENGRPVWSESVEKHVAHTTFLSMEGEKNRLHPSS